jgi:hypothetical protein
MIETREPIAPFLDTMARYRLNWALASPLFEKNGLISVIET